MCLLNTRSLGLIGWGCLVLSSCHPKPPAPPGDDARQRKDLGQQIQKLRREVVMLRQSTKGPEQVDISNWEKASGDPRAELQLLQREVFQLARTLDSKMEEPAQDGPVLRFVAAGAKQVLDVTIPEGASSHGYVLSNTGDNILRDPRVTPEGMAPINSAEDILAGILEGKHADHERAVALWDFVRNSRQHYFPSQRSSETEDPVKLANIYGYGYCDDAATALAWLATAAGYQARVWDLNGHVVPEIFYQNAWHMLDPDEEVYYLGTTRRFST